MKLKRMTVKMERKKLITAPMTRIAQGRGGGVRVVVMTTRDYHKEKKGKGLNRLDGTLG
jgi:hypothetical protein